jgi:hypothetical protein
VEKFLSIFKERNIFKHYIPMAHECFDTDVYKLCNLSDCTYDTKLCALCAQQKAKGLKQKSAS